MIPKPHPLENGLVVIFEGIDGVGKTTQIKLAREALQNEDWPVLVTRNMGGTPIGEALREVIMSPLERPPLTDFYASLAVQEPLLDLVDEARAEGSIILMDRGPLSLAAYQIYGAGIDEKLGWQHVDRAMSRIKPDIVILYDMDPEAALRRNREHPEKSSYFENKPLGYFQKVAEGFKEAAKRYPQVEVIDGAKSIPEVQERTMDAIARMLK